MHGFEEEKIDNSVDLTNLVKHGQLKRRVFRVRKRKITGNFVALS